MKKYLKQLTVNSNVALGTRVACIVDNQRTYGVVVDATVEEESWFKVALNKAQEVWLPYHNIFKIARKHS